MKWIFQKQFVVEILVFDAIIHACIFKIIKNQFKIYLVSMHQSWKNVFCIEKTPHWVTWLKKHLRLNRKLNDTWFQKKFVINCFLKKTQFSFSRVYFISFLEIQKKNRLEFWMALLSWKNVLWVYKLSDTENICNRYHKTKRVPQIDLRDGDSFKENAVFTNYKSL